MLTAVIILSILVAVLAFALFQSVRRNLELEDRFEEQGEQVDESLDILNDCYQRIAKVAEMPVTSDDPIIQQLLADIKIAKQAILLIANKVVTFDRDEDEGDTEE